MPLVSRLKVTLPCPLNVDNVSALQACEVAAADCKLRVVARTRRSVVLMPGPLRSLFSTFACMAPGASPHPGTSHQGAGITAELVTDDTGEGLAVLVIGTKEKKGDSFVAALTKRLGSLGAGCRDPRSIFEDNSSSASRFRKEAQAYYYFSRLLHSSQQAPGREAAELVTKLRELLKADHAELPMRDCMAAVRELCKITEEVHSRPPADGSANPRAISELMPWLQNSVERCIFSQVGAQIWRIYESRHATEDARFAEKVRALSVMSDEALMQMLDIRPEFRGKRLRPLLLELGGSSEDKEVSNTALMTPSTAADTDELASQEQREAPGGSSIISCVNMPETAAVNSGQLESVPGAYERAAALLSQLGNTLSGRGCSPREAVEALSLSQLEMKTCALEASRGKAELYSMDDIMPVFILILVRSSLSKPFASARFMADALSEDERLDNEGRAVLLLDSAARHVAFDWEFQDDISDSRARSAMKL